MHADSSSFCRFCLFVDCMVQYHTDVHVVSLSACQFTCICVIFRLKETQLNSSLIPTFESHTHPFIPSAAGGLGGLTSF
jgi:hypothetical protein